MTVPVQSAQVYTDLQGLDSLRRSAKNDSPETLRFVAEQFEAIFLQMMLKSAHGDGDGDSDEGDLFGNQQTEFYQDWHDKQLALHLASGKGVGIADMLVKQLQVKGVDSAASTEASVMQHGPKPDGLNQVVRQPASALTTRQTTDQNPISPVSRAADKNLLVDPDSNFADPQSFAKQLWPHAKAAADQLGVSPEVILAQAALETGWGKKVNAHSNGKSSFNLFNIKADGRWNGDRVAVSTLEYRDGVAVRENAQFRSYDSYAESFADFVAFIKTSPRYQSALDVAADAKSFVHELSKAGYATDPEYPNKIMKIATGEPLNEALDAIKI